MFAYSNNGLSFRAVEDDYIAKDGEVLFPDLATSIQLSQVFPQYSDIKRRADIIAQIAEIEKTVTQRRMREATLDIDGGWLANIEDQIDVLREELKNV